MSGEAAYRFIRGQGPLIISVPHAGTEVPADISERFSTEGAKLPDTDFWVDRLYEFAPELGASLIAARYSRYVIDLNRPPDDAALYESKVPGLLPLKTFRGQAIYTAGSEPDSKEQKRRLEQYWRPYHQALREALIEKRRQHGQAILLDAHSIASQLPLLFEGELPALNLGSNEGRSAAPEVIEHAWEVLAESGYSSVRDGRFKGGYITRHYGRPQAGIHALQLEMAQRTYMNENPPGWRGQEAQAAQNVLRKLVSVLLDSEMAVD